MILISILYAGKPVPTGASCVIFNETNIDAEVIILDVNSMSYNAGPNHPKVVQSESECCEECLMNDECNAWTFCPLQEGCGQGCTSKYDYHMDPSQIDASIHFGPFGVCGENQKWPYLMCSLKKLPKSINGSFGDADNLPVYKDQSSSDWISGVVAPP